MDTEYKILLNNRQVGVAVIKHEGLYCHYKCTCRFPENNIYRIVVKSENRSVNLGVCIPKGEYWETCGKVPAKKMMGIDFTIIAQPCSDESGIFIPISPNSAFLYLDDLEKCRYSVQNGQPGLLLKK